MTDVIVQGKPVEKEADNPDNTPGLAGYKPEKDPNHPAYVEDSRNEVVTEKWPGLAPSVNLDVDTPGSPYYQNPSASDFFHASPSDTVELKDGTLTVLPPEVKENERIKEARENLAKVIAEEAKKATEETEKEAPKSTPVGAKKDN